MEKTLAMKLLEGKRIPYQTFTYPPAVRDAEAIAREFGVSAAQVFKTLVVPAPRNAPPSVKPMLVMIPADKQLDLKKLAKMVKLKKLKMATHAEAESLTGLKVGGISALALLNRGFAMYLDDSAQTHPEIFVSAGQRGINLKVPVSELVRLTRARLINVCA